MDETYTVTYKGSAPFVSMLAQMLDAEGVKTSYEPPMESRGVPLASDVNDVVVVIVATGSVAGIKVAIERFRNRVPKAHVSYQPRHAEKKSES